MSDPETTSGDAQTAAALDRTPATDEESAPLLEHERRPRRFRGSGVSASERERLLREVRNVDFAMGLRGYDRGAVDRYVEQVNRLIAELEISSSPESAVRHALDEVSEETRELLQRAHETADEITARSRMKSDERLEHAAAEAQQLLDSAHRKADELREQAQREARELGETAAREAGAVRETAEREAGAAREAAERDAQQTRNAAQQEAEETRAAARHEAEAMLSAAEARSRELTRNAEAVWRERRRLIDDMRAVGEQLVAIGEAEGKRFQHFVGDPLIVGEIAEPSASNGHEVGASN
jgi:DivIVA domain-containing protein